MADSEHVEDQWRRVGLLVVASVLFSVATFLYVMGRVPAHREVVLLLGVAYAGAFGLTLCAFAPAARWHDHLMAGVMLFALFASFYVGVRIVNAGYATDSLALLHVGGEALISGRNPYEIALRDVAPDLAQRFGLPEELLTFRTQGEPFEHAVAYPGLALLLVAPFLWAGGRDLRWLIFGAEIISWLLLYFRAPKSLRPVIWLPVIAEVNLFMLYAQGGVTDWLWVPVMMVCLHFLSTGRGVAAGLALGTAAAIKQVPWLAAPFAAIWIWNVTLGISGQKARATLRFTCASLAAFLLWNVPFIIWNVRAWALGVLEPFLSPTVPFGSGLSLLVQADLLRLPREFYIAVQMVVLAATLVTYHLLFPSLRHSTWVFVPLVYWFGYRSLHNYFASWIPLIVWGFIGWWEERASLHVTHSPLSLKKPLLTAGAWAVGTVLLLGAVFAHFPTAPALDLRVVGAHDEFAVGVPTAITLDVANNSERPVHPRFWVSWGPFSFPWKAEGPHQIGPGTRERYTIRAPTAAMLPPFSTTQPAPFVVRVNDAASSVFAASTPIRLRLPPAPVRNPRFRFWLQAKGTPPKSRPLSWVDQSWATGGDQSSATLREEDGVHALRLEVFQDGKAGSEVHGDWVASALFQRILAPCGLALWVRPGFEPRFAGPWPAAALSLQILDGERAIWIVLGGKQDGNVSYSLPNGTRLFVVGAPTDRWSRKSVRLRDLYKEAGWSAPSQITLKIALAAHVSVLGHYVADIGAIEGMRDPC